MVFKTPNQDTEFLERLNLFLEKEGQTVPGMFRVLGHEGVSPATVPYVSPELLAHLLGQAIAHAPQPLLPVRYWKLRVFSGSAVPPRGEEPFEVWLEQATEIVKEWPGAEAEKERWLMESRVAPPWTSCTRCRRTTLLLVQKSVWRRLSKCLEAWRAAGPPR